MKYFIQKYKRIYEWLVALAFAASGAFAVWQIYASFGLDWSERYHHRRPLSPGSVYPWNARSVPDSLESFVATQSFRPFGKLGLSGELLLAHTIPLLVLASLAVSVAVWIACVRSHRRPGRSLGFVLGLAAVLGALAGAGLTVLGHVRLLDVRIWARHDAEYWSAVAFNAIEATVPSAGWMVIGSWVVLAGSGRGWPTRSRLDRIGTAVAAVWVALLVYSGG